MTRSISKHLFVIFLFISLGTTLSGCAKGKSGTSAKVGMHFDAVLEFVVEYPLSWSKDRRLPYGSSNGEVRWTHPDHPGVLLRIKSTKESETPLEGEYAGLEISSNEQVNIKAGEAVYISGQTGQTEIKAYLLSLSNRNYLITLEKDLDDPEDYQEVMDKVLNSFRVISG